MLCLQYKNPTDFILVWVKSVGFLRFRRLRNIQVVADLYIHRRRKQGCLEGRSPFGSGFPIGASSTPVGKGSPPEGNGVPLDGRFPKEGSAFLGTRLSLGKSSVLYLCFRLTPGRGWLWHLQPGQIDSGQILLVGSRSGGFCTITDEIGICTEGEIRLPGKGSRGISSPVPPQRQRPH